MATENISMVYNKIFNYGLVILFDNTRFTNNYLKSTHTRFIMTFHRIVAYYIICE